MVSKEILYQLIWAASAGVVCQIISEKLRQPSIFFLLLAGLLLGPHGVALLNPDQFRAGLPFLVEAAVIVILFEGSLSLNLEHVRKLSGVIRGLTLIGGTLTTVLAAFAAHFLIGVSWGISFAFGALVSVTGPTVIGPIIKRISLKKQLATTLLWESIVLDPIGAIIAVVVIEIILSQDSFFLFPVIQFPLRLAVGIVLGIAVGYVAKLLLKIRNVASVELQKTFVLTLALFCYGVSEKILPHSGLVAIVTLGIFLGNAKINEMNRIIEFKETLTTFFTLSCFCYFGSQLKYLLDSRVRTSRNFSCPDHYLCHSAS